MLLATLLFGLLAGALQDVDTDPAASPEPGLATGVIVDPVASRSEPDVTYALYLPGDFTPERRWPVLLLMDPRGRALVPLELFRPAAERLGYVLISSHDTASDGPREPNILAMRGLLPEIEQRFRLAPGRLYLAGFSGTARFGWDMGVILGDNMGGLIGVGGGYPEGFAPDEPPGFPFFGAAGTADFNYEEMQALDRERAAAGLPHRFVPFPGTHSWPPAEVATAALEWMELHAMRTGRAPRRDDLIAGLHAAAVERAEALADKPAAAAAAWAAVAEDFAGLRDVSAAAARAAELAQREDVRAAREQELELAAEREEHDRRLSAWIRQLAGSPRPPATARSLRALDIAELRRQLGAGDDMAAAAARRTLENVFVFCSFYLPRELLQAERPEHALAALDVADAVKPDHPQVCAGRARAYARQGQKKKGLAALDCLRQSGQVGPDFVESDPGLAPLRSGEAYQELMTSWRAEKPE